MPLSEVFSIILMGAASLVCIALIFYLNKITKSVAILTENISGLRSQITPVLQNVTEMTEKVNLVADDLKEPINNIIDLVDGVKKKIDVVFNFEEKIRTSITANFSGVFNGIKSFWSSYKHNGKTTQNTLIHHRKL